MQISFRNFKREYAFYKASIDSAIENVHQSHQYILGNAIGTFEKAFAKYCSARYCLGVGSGLAALSLILKGYQILGKIKEGDSILVPAHTFIATFLSVSENRLRPIPVDIRTDNFTIDPNVLPADKSVKAIILVHLYGQICDINAIRKWAKERAIIVIEDAAQAQGAVWQGYKSGALADAAAFSFYPTKNLGALTDAGAITTSDTALYEVIKQLRNYGKNQKGQVVHFGTNSRLSDLMAAVLEKKLPYLDEQNKTRQRIANRYLEEIKNPALILPSKPTQKQTHVWYLFVLQTSYRTDLAQFLSEKQIQTKIHYATAAYREPCFKAFCFSKQPNTDLLIKRIISIPLHPFLEKQEVDYVIACLNQFRPNT